ncbi:MAG: galactokinase family protein, partial [Myxococcota bacterium]|nr:galactokinase family protein [Myxococcota bacterium]
MPIVVRYPGRICLLGEHCDWAGGASLAVPMPLSIEIEVEAAERGLHVHSSMDGELLEGHWDVQGKVDREGGALRFVPAAAHALFERGVGPRPVHLWVRADLPTGRGFSSSAAFTLAVLDALSRNAGHVLDSAELAELAFHVENELLGVDCGRLDQLSCAAAQPVYLEWSEGRAKSRRIPLKSEFNLVVAAFSAPRDTAAILSVLNLHHRVPPAQDTPTSLGVKRALRIFGQQAELGSRALELGDAVALGEAMNRAQQVYEVELHEHLPALRAPRLVMACRGLRDRGALGAKFSGAGGDGSVV